MKFSTELDSHALQGPFKYFLSICGMDPWAKRIADLDALVRSTSSLAEYVRDRYPIELAMGSALIEYLENGAISESIMSAEQYALYAFIVTTSEVHLRLSESGKNRLSGMIRDGLRSDKGLASFQHEITTATHLMNRGVDVDFVDLEQGGIDYVARVGALEIEVECKSISADIGRQIPRRHAAQLFTVLGQVLEDASKKVSGGTVLHIRLTDRLTNNPAQQALIRSLVVDALQNDDGTCSQEGASATRHRFDLSDSPFVARSRQDFNAREAGQFLQSRFSIVNREVISLIRPGHSALIVALDSARPDKVVGGIARQLRDSAKKQFSKTRPGILAVQLYGLSSDEFSELVADSGGSPIPRTSLDVIANELFRGDSTRHMLAIVFRSHGQLQSRTVRTSRIFQRSTHAAGSTYVCTNLAHPLSKNRGTNPFLGPAIKSRRRS